MMSTSCYLFNLEMFYILRSLMFDMELCQHLIFRFE